MLAWINSGLEKLGRVVSGLKLTDSGGFLGFGTRTESGEVVTPDVAMTLSAVFCAVDLYGCAHVAMPCGVLAKNGSKRSYADYNPAHRLIHSRPNPEMNAGVYWRLVEHHRLLWGVSFSEIEWNGRGEPKYLWPIEPWRVTVRRRDESDPKSPLVYEVRDGRGDRTLSADDVLIFPHVTTDGITFKSALTYGAETVGGALAAQKTGNKWFAAGGIPQGFVKHPGRMDPAARQNFRKEWKENALNGAGNVGILWEGMDFLANQMDPESLQLLATKEFSVTDIARFMRVPPHKLMQLVKSSYSTNEQADLEWVKGSILPVVVDKEQEINNKLLRYPDFYCKFAFEGLLRGDSAARAAWVKSMREIGAYSVNDVLDYEDMDRIGPEGDVRVVNSTYIPLHLIEEFWRAKSVPGATPPGFPPDPPDGTPSDPTMNEPPRPAPTPPEENETPPAPRPRRKLAEDPFFAAELGRVRRREIKALQKAAKHPGEFMGWMDDFYPRHRLMALEILRPAVDAWMAAEDVTDDVSEVLALRFVDSEIAETKSKLLQAMEVPASDFEASIQRYIATIG